jgi:mono/diheme cytochrome c family protein
MIGALVAYLGVLVVAVSAQGAARPGGWNIPATASTEKNPLTVNDAVMAGGKKLYEAKCQRCHGKTGKGDGPDAEADKAADMDLTAFARGAKNPDGVVFYKIWNGRVTPKMPPLNEDSTKEQVWAIVAYSQSLRAKQ